MILQALNSYYHRKCADSDPTKRLPAFGLEQKEIPFLLEITREGCLVQMIDTRTMLGKKMVAQTFRVPQGVKRASGVAANLLWDRLDYALGIGAQSDSERIAKQHAAFLARINAMPPDARNDTGIKAVLTYLGHLDLSQLETQPAWAQVLESNGVISFRLHGDVDLICQRPAVIGAALNSATESQERVAMCLVTGDTAPVELLHTAIKGVWGAQSAGANIVSFNARAFESYGKKERQGENAPIGKAAAFAYTTALNYLLRKDSDQRIQVGDASTVFWTDRESEFESAAANIFGEPSKDDPDQGVRAVQALFAAVQDGRLGGVDGDNRFHILGLAPNAARISVRFYHCLPLREMAACILQHFNDLDVVRGPNDPQYSSMFRLLRSVAVQSKADNIPPNLGGAIVNTIFAGANALYPAQWLNAAVIRCRAEQTVNHPRAAAIKACLNRQIRRAATLGAARLTEKEFLPMLDPGSTNSAYRLGRLFATLEKIQEEASPGLNATIRDRYYGAASSSPVSVFTTLLRLKNAHLKKISVGRALWFEKLLGEILSSLNDFPKHLTLSDQGRFALGYYHQRQDFFTSKSDI